MAKAYKHKLLEVVAENVRGKGAEIFGALKEAGVNIEAHCIWTQEDQAFFWIVPDDFDKARKALRKLKLRSKTLKALVAEIPNRPGAYADLLAKVAEAGVDMKVAWATAAVKKVVKVIMTTSSDTKALKAING